MKAAVERGDAPFGKVLWPDKWPQMKEVLMGEQTVSVGRNVHFTEDGKTCLHANVAGVNEDGSINIGYLARTGGSRQAQTVKEDPEKGLNTWHWPERV